MRLALMIERWAFHLLFAALVGSCTTTKELELLSATDSPIIISTLDLFSQAEAGKGSKSWQGDWEFRRDRLDVIDNGLRDIRPDIAIFQNSLNRIGSTSESDKIILSAGGLARYEWHDAVIDTLKESGEERSLAIAVARPFLIDTTPTEDRNYWQMGADGHLAFFTLNSGAEPILIADVLMPSRRDQVGLWYSFVQERIQERIKQRKACLNRIIVAGYLPIDQDNRRAREFMDILRLKDSATGFCQNAERCQTATVNNEMFSLTRSDEGGGQVDRILVNMTANVVSAGLAFTRSVESTQYKDIYNLSRIWVGPRFGWMTRVKIAQCRN